MIDNNLFSNMTIQEDVLRLRIENEELKQQVAYLGMKLFNLLSEYEIGSYDNDIHQFYKDVYAIHNELMEIVE